NGQSETLIAIEKQGKYYTLDNLDLLASQLPGLRKKFTSYHAFAGKTFSEVFMDSELQSATLYEVDVLASGYLKNTNGTFEFVQLPMLVQSAPVMAQLRYDLDGDGID